MESERSRVVSGEKPVGGQAEPGHTQQGACAPTDPSAPRGGASSFCRDALVGLLKRRHFRRPIEGGRERGEGRAHPQVGTVDGGHVLFERQPLRRLGDVLVVLLPLAVVRRHLRRTEQGGFVERRCGCVLKGPRPAGRGCCVGGAQHDKRTRQTRLAHGDVAEMRRLVWPRVWTSASRVGIGGATPLHLVEGVRTRGL